MVLAPAEISSVSHLQDLAAAVDPTGIADIVQSFAAEDCGPLKVEAIPEDGLVEDGDLKDSESTQKKPKEYCESMHLISMVDISSCILLWPGL